MDASQFKPGDLITRDGTDRHRVIAVNDAGDLVTVECIREPLGFLGDDGDLGEPWIRLGEIEENLAKRYSPATETEKPVETRRRIALQRMERAGTFYGSVDKSWRVLDRGDHVTFVGTTSDGRQFSASYQAETAEERAAAR